MPVIRLLLRGPRSESASCERVIVDTGGLLHLSMSSGATARVRPWVWQESVGRVRQWSIQQGAGSLGVLPSIDLGGIQLLDVPVLLPPPHGTREVSTLGIAALAKFEAVEFDWGQSTLTLRRTVECAESGVGTPTGACVEAFRWWHPIDNVATRGGGFVVVQGRIGRESVPLLFDTACGADLLLPRSVATTPPWRDVVEQTGSIQIHSPTGATCAERQRFTGNLSIGGAELTNLLVVVFDDSTLPPGAAAVPILGAPAMRRFERVTFHFDVEQVVFVPRAASTTAPKRDDESPAATPGRAPPS